MKRITITAVCLLSCALVCARSADAAFIHMGVPAPPDAVPEKNEYWSEFPEDGMELKVGNIIWIGFPNEARPKKTKRINIKMVGTDLNRFKGPPDCPPPRLG